MGTLLKSCSWLFWILWAVNVHANATFSIDASTPVQFSDKQVLVAQDLTGQATAPGMLQRLNEFAPAAAFPTFRLDVTYWVYQHLENKLSSDLTLRLDASGWKNMTAHVIREDGLIQALPATGFVPPHNPYLTKSLQHTQLSEFPSPFPIFTLKAHEKVALLTRVNVLSLFPPKSFSFQILENTVASDYRRYGLYLEGLLLGSLLSLTAFALFNAFHSKDKTDAFYALWIGVAFMAVFALGVIDGNRLFEFFIDIEGLSAFNQESYGFIWALGLSFAQAICYVMFARQYLGIQTHFPVFHQITNGWIAFAVIFTILSLSGVFYWPSVVSFVPNLAIAYSLSITLILLSLFVCSYLRYRSGFGFAKYFFYAIIPYIVFRINFVFSVKAVSHRSSLRIVCGHVGTT